MSKDFVRFMLINGFLSSIANIFIKRIVAIERLPIQYFFLGGLIAAAITGLLYLSVRHWPGNRKTWIVWLTGFLLIAAALWGGRD